MAWVPLFFHIYPLWIQKWILPDLISRIYISPAHNRLGLIMEYVDNKRHQPRCFSFRCPPLPLLLAWCQVSLIAGHVTFSTPYFLINPPLHPPKEASVTMTTGAASTWESCCFGGETWTSPPILLFLLACSCVTWHSNHVNKAVKIWIIVNILFYARK